MYKSLITVSLLAMTALGWVQNRRRSVVLLGEGRMIVEWSPGKEAVLHVGASSEEALQRIQIFRPDGRKLAGLDAPSSGGLSSVELELSEPTLESLIANYAEGSYDIRADTVGGNLALGNAQLSLDLPPAPHVVHPQPNQLVQASNLTVRWLPGGDVVGVDVEIEQDGDDGPGDGGLRVRLPPELSSFRVPHRLLAPGIEATLEVVAIAANGNRTVTEVLFMPVP